jgi:putative endonuclease
MLNNKQLGYQGEKLILENYSQKGYTLIVSNFEYRISSVQGRMGEIDLILKHPDKKIIVMVEVKTRNSQTFGDIKEQLSRKQIGHLYKAYQYFLYKNKNFQDHNFRFDFATVYKGEIEIIENAVDFDGLV